MKPAFWTDLTLSRLGYDVRLFYIGLWNIADDAGWLSWEPERIGAELFPYETPKSREKRIAKWQQALEDAGRLVRYDCGCVHIPTLPTHQRITGKTSTHALSKHQRDGGKQLVSTREAPDSPGNGSGSGSGTVGNGTERNGSAPAGAKSGLSTFPPIGGGR